MICYQSMFGILLLPLSNHWEMHQKKQNFKIGAKDLRNFFQRKTGRKYVVAGIKVTEKHCAYTDVCSTLTLWETDKLKLALSELTSSLLI